MRTYLKLLVLLNALGLFSDSLIAMPGGRDPEVWEQAGEAATAVAAPEEESVATYVDLEEVNIHNWLTYLGGHPRLEPFGFKHLGLSALSASTQGVGNLGRFNDLLPHMPFSKPVCLESTGILADQRIPKSIKRVFEEASNEFSGIENISFQVIMYPKGLWGPDDEMEEGFYFTLMCRERHASDQSFSTDEFLQSVVNEYRSPFGKAFKRLIGLRHDDLYSIHVDNEVLSLSPMMQAYLGYCLYSCNKKTLANKILDYEPEKEASKFFYRALGMKELNPLPPEYGKLLTRAAVKGHIEAQVNLGALYYQGKIGLKEDGQPDYIKTADLYRQAADQGYVLAQSRLGVLYTLGKIGVKDDGSWDFAQAAVYFRQAAAQGHDIALNGLAALYDKGKIGLKKNGQSDYTKAADLYRKAAAQGHSNAQFNLGLLYAIGNYGVVNEKPNYEKAAELYRKAAAQGHALAQNNLAALYANGKIGLKENGQPDYTKAADLYRQAAEHGNVEAQFNLGVLYTLGKIGVKDDGSRGFAQAALYFRQAAAQGHVNAQFNLGLLYAQGRIGAAGGRPNYDKALQIFRQAAAQGHVGAREEFKKIKAELDRRRRASGEGTEAKRAKSRRGA